MKSSKGKKSTKSAKTKKGKLLKKDIDNYKDKLFNLRDDTLKQIKDISEDTLMKSQKEASGDISGYSIHIADAATDSYERDFNINLVSTERKMLMDIDEALKRIEDNDYGFCQMCGCSIAKKRLDAIPYAKYDKKCQEKIEKENQIR